MNRSHWPRLWAAVILAVVVCGLASPAAAAEVSDRQQVIKQAREAYYSLRRLGLLEFRTNLSPRWEVALGQKKNSDNAAAFHLLEGLHFLLSLDPAGKVKVDHRADVPPPTQEAAEGFNQIYSGMDQAMGGFFATWSLFMLNSPFPEVDSDYRLEDLGGGYRLSYKEGTTEVVTSFNKGLAITEIHVAAPDFDSTIKPQFTKTAGAYVLSGYEGDYRPASGPGVAHLKVLIDYQEVSGLQVVRTLFLDSVLDGKGTKMEIAFNDYQVKSR